MKRLNSDAFWRRLHHRLFLNPGQLRGLMHVIAREEGYVRWPVALCGRPVWVEDTPPGDGEPLWPGGPTPGQVRRAAETTSLIDGRYTWNPY